MRNDRQKRSGAFRVTETSSFGPGLDWPDLPIVGQSRRRRNPLAFIANPWLWMPLVSALFWWGVIWSIRG